eukprot:3198493-Pyramimonas_sp.AAC.1
MPICAQLCAIGHEAISAVRRGARNGPQCAVRRERVVTLNAVGGRCLPHARRLASLNENELEPKWLRRREGW